MSSSLASGTKSLIFGGRAFVALARAEGAELRPRAARHRFTAAHQLDACHEGGAHSAHSRSEDAQFSFWRSNTYWPAHSVSPIRMKSLSCTCSPRRFAKAKFFCDGCVLNGMNLRNKTTYDAATL